MRLFLGFCLLLTAVFACEVETEFVTGEAVQLRFSTDTLSFDTVFTERGSATRQFKVYNDADDPIMIDRITVAGQTGVTYTFNVDGTMGPEAKDIAIFGKDSIFVFVEVEVDPGAPKEVSPFIAEDQLVFETGTVQEEVTLLAFGQDALYLNSFDRGNFFGLSCQSGTLQLPSDLPIVIYGSYVIDSCVVQLLAGTEIYMYGGIQRNPIVGGSGIFNDGFILVQENGSLQILGTQEEPVFITTDRLEEEFEQAPGTYRGLVFSGGSRNNIIRHATIRNAIIGVTADSLAEVTIESSIISNTRGPAVTGYQSDITARNSLFHSNFGNTIQILKGGNLTLEHCTLANYGVDASSLLAFNYACDENNTNCLAFPLRARIRNSILAGSRGAELILDDGFDGDEPGFYDFKIFNSVVRTDERFLTSDDDLLLDFYTDECSGCYNLQPGDPLFVSIDEDDYHLDSLSVARHLGPFIPELPVDLEGVSRGGGEVDAGALERE